MQAARQPVANSSIGVSIYDSTNATIGGTDSGARNILSGNSFHGIRLSGGGGHTIQGNYIGTDVNGTTAVGNGRLGIQVTTDSNSSVIGGSAAGATNVISANGWDGILINGSDSNEIYGNYIGLQQDGSSSLGNARSGVQLKSSAVSNIVGGVGAGEGNIIANNDTRGGGYGGVFIFGADSDYNTIRGNVIYDNDWLAVSLGLDGSNDDIAATTVDSATTTDVAGSGASASATVDVYTNTDGDTDCLVYVGTATADGSGDWSLGSLSLTAGHYAVAIQTDGSGNSSGVSTAVAIVSSADYTVNTTTDENDGSCSDGDCSLRDALTLVANGETIDFSTSTFPPGTPATISVSGSALPTLDNSSVTIDASNAGVIIDGAALTAADMGGITITGDSNTVKGLQIINFDTEAGSYYASGILINGGSSNVIGGSFNASADNGLGEGCRLSSNLEGIVIVNAGNGNTIRGCLIGTNLAGDGDDGNVYEGIWIESSSNTIGDSTAAHRNIISGNGDNGILLGGGANGNVIKGNYIGSNLAGTGAIGNDVYGIMFYSGPQSNIIGSTTSGEENLIAYNGSRGICTHTPTTKYNSFRGNILHGNVNASFGPIQLAVGSQELIGTTTIDTVTTSQVDGSGAVASAWIDVYSNDDGDLDCEVYVGSVQADGSGDWTLSGLSLTSGHYVVAIQTNSNNSSSAVSAAVVVP